MANKIYQSLFEILDDEFYDIKIEVRKDHIHAHMVILYYRFLTCELRRILLARSNDGNLADIKSPNILPEISNNLKVSWPTLHCCFIIILYFFF